jgi:hypothetical protein
MTTTTATYSVTRDQIILAALRKLGAIEPADTTSTIESAMVTNASMALNLLIKMWAVDGLKLWTIDEYTLPLVASQTSYTIGPSGCNLTAIKPLKLIQAFVRNKTVTPNIDIPLQIFSKQEYNMLGSKASTGLANTCFLDPRVTSSTLYVYLTPTAFTATNYEIHLVVQHVMNDITAGSDVPQFPVEWMQALVWNLADQLAIEYSVPGNHRLEIAAKATMYREQMVDFDVEYSSTFFTPDSRFGLRR